LITYATSEAAIRRALDAMMADGHIAEPPQLIRIERSRTSIVIMCKGSSKP